MCGTAQQSKTSRGCGAMKSPRLKLQHIGPAERKCHQVLWAQIWEINGVRTISMDLDGDWSITRLIQCTLKSYSVVI